MINERNRAPSGIKVFRWFFLITALELILYYLVPAVQFPAGYRLHIEVISALTLGNVVAVFFLLANLAGLLVDRGRRLLYASLLVATVLWLILIVVTWANLEHWEFLLR